MKSPYQPLSEINVTPLVDVVLVLLIIFMIATPLLENGMSVRLPKVSPKHSLPKTMSPPLVLTLNKAAKIYLGTALISLSSLPNALDTYFKDKPNKEVFIRADAAVLYGTVAEVIALVKQSGVQKIGLVTLPKENQ